MEFYTQVEVQISAEGVKGAIPMIYDNYNDALAKHYTVLSVAASSALPYHASFIIKSDGITVESKVFDRRVIEAGE